MSFRRPAASTLNVPSQTVPFLESLTTKPTVWKPPGGMQGAIKLDVLGSKQLVRSAFMTFNMM